MTAAQSAAAHAASAPLIRPAAAQDAAAIARLYNHYIQHTTHTLQETPATAADFSAPLRAAAPFLAAEQDGALIGYAYADIMKSRCGYRYSYESSIYVAPQATGRGAGAALLSALIPAAAAHGARNLVAVISLPNPASVALHEKHGFTHRGTLPAIGYKFGKWFDCGYWQKKLPA